MARGSTAGRVGRIDPAATFASSHRDEAAESQRLLVEQRVTCPFVGSAVLDGALPVISSGGFALASIDDLRRLGNSGGGRLGDVLAFFAHANHRRRPDSAARVEAGQFSLDLPGSLGSHPGHSGILEGDPRSVASGRFSRADYDRLLSRATEGRLTGPAIAAFIAENVRRDPQAIALGTPAIFACARALAGFAGAFAWTPVRLLTFRRPVLDPLYEASGRLLAWNNLIGSAGEFGLLLAFLEASPRSERRDGGLAVGVEDLEALFVRRTLPEGALTWPKRASAWMGHTLVLAGLALGAFQRAPAPTEIRRPSLG